MNLLDRFNQRLGFTRNESLVVLFLAGSLLLGGAIKMTRVITPEQDNRYDYTKSDHEFAEKSSVIRMTDSSDERGAAPDSLRGKKFARSGTSTSAKLKTPPDKKINLNTSGKQDLMRLPGIGEVTAERILMYREEHGSFKTIDELQDVKGIGKKKFERLAPYVTVGQ